MAQIGLNTALPNCTLRSRSHHQACTTCINSHALHRPSRPLDHQAIHRHTFPSSLYPPHLFTTTTSPHTHSRSRTPHLQLQFITASTNKLQLQRQQAPRSAALQLPLSRTRIHSAPSTSIFSQSAYVAATHSTLTHPASALKLYQAPVARHCPASPPSVARHHPLTKPASLISQPASLRPSHLIVSL